MKGDEKGGKVYLVTGANKGIGLQVVKELCRLKGPLDSVYLTARNIERGNKAVNDLKEEGLDPRFLQLDITSKESIEAVAEYIRTQHGGLDVLINNAGIAFKNAATEPFAVQAKVTLETNYFGTQGVCTALIPLIEPGGRVVNVSSSCGHLSKINGQEPAASELRAELSSPTLTLDRLNQLMNQFIKTAEEGTHVEHGWPNSAYKVSKVGVSALTILQQRDIDKTRPEDDIAINHVHPGYVDTDMTSHKGHWSVEQGCKALLVAATLPSGSDVKGEYIWEDGTVTSWTEANVNLFY